MSGSFRMSGSTATLYGAMLGWNLSTTLFWLLTFSSSYASTRYASVDLSAPIAGSTTYGTYLWLFTLSVYARFLPDFWMCALMS